MQVYCIFYRNIYLGWICAANELDALESWGIHDDHKSAYHAKLGDDKIFGLGYQFNTGYF